MFTAGPQCPLRHHSLFPAAATADCCVEQCHLCCLPSSGTVSPQCFLRQWFIQSPVIPNLCLPAFSPRVSPPSSQLRIYSCPGSELVFVPLGVMSEFGEGLIAFCAICWAREVLFLSKTLEEKEVFRRYIYVNLLIILLVDGKGVTRLRVILDLWPNLGEGFFFSPRLDEHRNKWFFNRTWHLRHINS